MLIKIKVDSLEIVKHSLTNHEDYYLECMKYPANVQKEDGEHLIKLSGEPENLYKMLYFISKSCDIEIM